MTNSKLQIWKTQQGNLSYLRPCLMLRVKLNWEERKTGGGIKIKYLFRFWWYMRIKTKGGFNIRYAFLKHCDGCVLISGEELYTIFIYLKLRCTDVLTCWYTWHEQDPRLTCHSHRWKAHANIYHWYTWHGRGPHLTCHSHWWKAHPNPLAAQNHSPHNHGSENID